MADTNNSSTMATMSGAAPPDRSELAQRHAPSSQGGVTFQQGNNRIPPGWTYNPSAWSQRLPILGIALLNSAIAAYLAVCQIWFQGHAWDPFFGSGTQHVLTSSVSQAFQVSDAALGAGTYALEAISCALGDAQRWRTKPWLTLIFGLLVLPLCLISIVLMILQPIVVHAWCGLCLVMLAGMLLMVPLALDEVIAALQFLLRSYQRHASFPMLWHVFWQGGENEDRQNAPASRPNKSLHKPLLSGVAAVFAGFTPSWNLVACLALGVGSLAAPAALGAEWEAATSLYVTGALVIVFSTLAMAEVTRSLRFLLMFCGVWLLVFAPWTLLGATASLKIIEMLMGAALMALSYPRGRIHAKYAGWERFMP